MLESHCQGKVSFHWAVGRGKEGLFQELCTGQAAEEEGLKSQSSTWGHLPLVRLPLRPSNPRSKVSHIKVLWLSMEGLYDIPCSQMIKAKPEADQ